MSMTEDFRNTNGLVDGKIPSGDPCPFLGKECDRPNEYCPTKDKPNQNDFSCGFARGASLIRNSKNEKDT